MRGEGKVVRKIVAVFVIHIREEINLIHKILLVLSVTLIVLFLMSLTMFVVIRPIDYIVAVGDLIF